MIAIFLNVLNQVAILLILIIIGVVLTKTNILTEKGVKSMTDMVLMLVTPCVIIKSFVRKFDSSTLKALIISFIAAIGMHLLFIAVAHLLCRSNDDARRRVLRFAVVFSNCGYMSIPLQQAVLGDDGVLFGASFVAIFNLFVWSYGIVEMSGDKKYISPKKLIVNPGIIGLTVGLIIFILSLDLPQIIYEPISYMASLNTPLPMIIIGYHLAQSNLIKGIKDKQSLFAIALRLIVLPTVVIGLLYLCGIRDTLLVSLSISACAPTAAVTTMFSSKFNKATDLSVNIVSISTVLSLITMPLLVTLTQYIS